MDNIVKYLSNPLEFGVWHTQLKIDISNINALLEEIKESSDDIISEIVSLFSDDEQGFYELETLGLCLDLLKNTDDCPKKIEKYLSSNIIEIGENISKFAGSRKENLVRMRLYERLSTIAMELTRKKKWIK